MTDREKLIELLHSGNRCLGVVGDGYGCCDCPHHSSEKPCDEFAATADMLIANGVTVQKWIPVTERLPEDDRPVLVTCGKGYRSFIARYDRIWKRWKVSHTLRITHWMPLPEPPKGE